MVLRVILVAFGLVALQATNFVQCQEPHDLLTDEEFARVFRTTRDNVPEYQVVPIMHDMYKRSTDKVRINFDAFDKNIDIHLDPIDATLAGKNTPVWLASAGSNGKVNYKKLSDNIVEKVSRSYLGLVGRAALVAQGLPARPRFHGTVDDVVITEWPARVQEVTKTQFENSKRKRDVTKTSRTLVPTDYHVVIKSKAYGGFNTEAMDKQVEKIVQRYNETEYKRPKRTANEVIYPSILVVTDYTGTSKSQDESALYNDIRYQLAFWNSVDLRYRNLENPRIRLRIAGLVIGQGHKATPYMQEALQGVKINGHTAWRKMQSYWYNLGQSNSDFDTKAYDIIITMTDTLMLDTTASRTKAGGLEGLASTSSLCDPIYSSFPAVGLVHDDAKFDGILTATHELGHIFGALHDEDKTGDCTEKLGYIMAPTKVRVPTLLVDRWSRCSEERMRRILGESSRHCADSAATYHNPGPGVPRIAPGDIVTAQEQCESYGFSYACTPEPKMCKKLQCYYYAFRGIGTGWACQNANVGAFDGTPCSKDAVCVRGECRESASMALIE